MRPALVLLAISGTAFAEPRPLPRASATMDLRLHVGDTEQDEVAHYGLYPSVVLGGTFRLAQILRLEAAIAAAKVSATWENIGGLANGYLGARLLLDPPPSFFPEGGYQNRWTIAAGVTLPLDRSPTRRMKRPSCSSSAPRSAIASHRGGAPVDARRSRESCSKTRARRSSPRKATSSTHRRATFTSARACSSRSPTSRTQTSRPASAVTCRARTCRSASRAW